MANDKETVEQVYADVAGRASVSRSLGDNGVMNGSDVADLIDNINKRWLDAHKRKMNQLPCNARDGECSSSRIGCLGEKEYCVVAKYSKDVQEELGDYGYHRVTGPLTFDLAKYWLDFHKRNRTIEEAPMMLVREVSEWRNVTEGVKE